VTPTVGYLANEFPSPVEPYVAEEIEELRRLGVRVIAGSVRKPAPDDASSSDCLPQVVLWPPHAVVLVRALGLCLRHMKRIRPLILRVLFQGREGPVKRIKALAHTWLGACYAVQLEGRRITHIHVHHGYLGSWIAMVAARLLGVEFSMTLHGSDLLLHRAYLDTKLENCAFCLTVSEYNRNYILEHYPRVDAAKVVVARLGVDVRELAELSARGMKVSSGGLRLLAVGRLHVVKDHAFLIRACAQLCGREVNLECAIAGEGPERRSLELLIRKCGLEKRVRLLGHVPRERMDSFYDQADVVVLTSRSEGIPLVLMEAMARGKVVLAPAITGIPELVIEGKTGFLYEAGSMDDFVARLLLIRSLLQSPEQSLPPSRRLDQIQRAARMHVRESFNRRRRLQSFGDFFLRRVGPQAESLPHEDLVLQ
jgi:glycosyltransferase involved in cell wall biosynthesis